MKNLFCCQKIIAISTHTSLPTVGALGHLLTHVDAKEPTCTENGNIEHYICTREGCGELFLDSEGTKGTTLDGVTLRTAHRLMHVDEVPSTCTEDGSIEHWVCTRKGCGKLFADANGTQELTPAEVILPKLVRTDTLPQTGDSSHLTGWLALLGACCAGLWCVNRRRG